MAHTIKCAICGEKFDTEIIQAVRYNSRRYAHYSCYPEGELVPLGKKEITLKTVKDKTLTKEEKEEKYRKLILNFARDNFGDDANYPMISKQIREFTQEGYTCQGIYYSLYYYYKVKHGSISKSKGAMGIVPYIYYDANKYFKVINNARNNPVNRQKIEKENISITIQEPKININKLNLFNLD